jgi:O-succinylbenzoate synthase
VSASARYWEEEVIDPPVTVSPRGTITVSDKPGIGFDIRHERIERLTVRRESFSAA